MSTLSDAVSERELTAIGRLVHQFRDALRREPDADAEAAVLELFPTGAARVEFALRFSALTMLSASIAAFGLLADSGAVVIGAMLVAPLMTPILAAAAAMVRAKNRELLIALLVIALGTVLAILVGFAISAFASDAVRGTADLPGEVRARTFPGLLDLGIAVTAGAAAGYILPRRSATSALPGVGIAVALVPPLVTVGITYELGAWAESRNALLLYLTNLAAIVFAASIMLILSGFRPRLDVSRRALVSRVLITAAAVAAVAVPLTIHTRSTVEDTQLRGTVSAALTEWDPTARVVELTVDAVNGAATVDLLVAGPNPPREVWTLAERIRDEFNGPVELDLQFQQDLRFRVSAR
ncbi:MAG: putative hydrophobic protein (TIGR00271 family) [Candidatus Aldehydirespiratoraceae bacterium]